MIFWQIIDQVLKFLMKDWMRFTPLYAGHRMVDKQAFSMLIAESFQNPGFGVG